MVLVWRNYQTDLGRAYPMYALSVFQVNEVSTDINPVDLLPPNVLSDLLRVRNACSVDQLTPRRLLLWTTDGAQFSITYPVPFSQNLADYLTAKIEITAWEWVGERVRYGRLRKLLDNV